jgi:hypothetical protein
VRIRLALLGAALIVAGIAALIIASDHHPVSAFDPSRFFVPVRAAAAWSRTAYDAVRMGGWALVVVGALVVALVLVREVRLRRA